MNCFYDLVIIGNTAAGREAALQAVGQRARVALVLGESDRQTESDRFAQILSDTLKYSLFETAGETSLDALAFSDRLSPATARKAFALARERAEVALTLLAETNTPAALATAGIDVVEGVGEFCRRPKLAFVVGERHLRSRRYLLAFPGRFRQPQLNGLATTGYLLPSDLGEITSLDEFPQRWIVLGSTPLGLVWAQLLARLGRDVMLVGSLRDLSGDAEMEQRLQAILEAEGVQIFAPTPAMQARRLNGSKWLQVGDCAIEADEILVVAGSQPEWEGLNLEGVGALSPGSESEALATSEIPVLGNEMRSLWVDDRLRTANPQIYACESAAWGDSWAAIANHDVRIALKNVLLLPWFKVNYTAVPRVVFTEPPLAWLGVSELQAREQYGKNIRVVRQDWRSLPRALASGEISGLLKLVLHSNGKLLGAQLLGTNAEELIGAIALSIRHQQNLNTLPADLFPSPTRAEIFVRAAGQWQQHQGKRDRAWRRWLNAGLR